MIYMIIRVNAAWLVHKLPSKNLLLLNLHSNSNHDSVQNKQHSDNLHKTKTQNDEDQQEYRNTTSTLQERYLAVLRNVWPEVIPSEYADSLRATLSKMTQRGICLSDPCTNIHLITSYKCLAAGRESNGTEKVSFKQLVFLFFDYPRPSRLFHNQQSKRGTNCRG